MNRWLVLLGLFGAVLNLSFYQSFSVQANNTDCPSTDRAQWIKAGEECLVAHVRGHPGGKTTLLVFIHGDGSKGGPSSYFYDDVERYSGDGVVAAALIRPGYFDLSGAQSSGTSYREQGDGYRRSVVSSVAQAIVHLKRNYLAQKVIVVGHSGGAAIAGIIIGKYPALVDYALLVACPCNIPEWRMMRRGKNNWRNSLSPHDYVERIEKTKIVVLAGGRDKNTKPILAKKYVRLAVEYGVDATFTQVSFAHHNSIVKTAEFAKIIRQFLAE